MNHEYQKTLVQSVSVCPIWPDEATRKIGQMIGEINQANTIMGNISATAQNAAIKGGFAAETFHAESFNLDAILKDKDVRAFTDGFKQTPLTRNDPTHDIVVMRDSEQVLGAQLKYFKDADATQKAFRSTRDGVHHYERADRFIGPSDQIEGIQASAHKTVLKNQQTRPEVARAAEKVRDNTAAQIEVDGVQSTPLNKTEAEQLGAGTQQGKDMHERMQNGYLNKATVQQSLRAAGSAAVITAVTAGCINTFQSIKLVRDGELSAEQAALCILRDTAIAAGDSALKAGVATASVSLAARSLPSLFSGSAFQTSLASGAIAGATVCAVDLVQCLVLFAAGKMTRDELETRTGKNIFQTGAAVVGAAVGSSIGALGGPVGMLIGSLVGGMITSLAMNIALDNHIEKSFRLTLAATEQVVANGLDAHGALQYLQQSQAYFAGFHQGLMLSERHFEQQIKTMQAQSTRLKSKINNL
ncbi:hypothetical protein WJ07_18055 [Burkholderia vietnamiensis]|jgi:hypothetical protein|uniref:hypothetical protein n=1 Tax=Burkholderia vietnamiensis TaxID=60552 RepID=UPI000754BC7C|nr:hypothetical protein [Burkholderia vietnamiensis]KVF21815.1 hypothetical protein WJ07_18055 [Burkholderia vietnamiensis]KVG06305.1 hypothetical protein WJ24_24705 [Burkholderia vietnamiensis]KVR81384.1 hypothetical protein WK26_13265 [Burkholderia vietnamiensis]KVS36586.1 hypothetical protein WK35_02525 [Burkholderia vietnamiensis]MBR8151224.1 hypothetical protein [Burkholderia vietnamiensis]